MFRPTSLLQLLLLLSIPVSAAQQYSYKVLEKKSLAPDRFVQGLEIIDSKLYLSSGGYGKSTLQRFDFSSGELELERKLDPRLFAEGLTVLGDRVYQLTWQARLLLVYKKDDLSAVARMQIPGEGWGLTNDGKQLIYSDGSDRLYFLSPDEHRITRAINVTLGGRPVTRLNELEWIDGRIWANIWQTDHIVVINPVDGSVERSLNLQGLLPVMERRPDTDVLNGIARNPADGSVWVTGKNWPWMYRIEVVDAPTDSQASTPGAPKTR